jgi:hypothetical protein
MTAKQRDGKRLAKALACVRSFAEQTAGHERLAEMERKKRQDKLDAIARAAAEKRAAYEREHPILSGAVPVVEYVPPAGNYSSGYEH